MSDSAAHPGPASHDVRPVVRTGGAGNRNLWLFLALLALGGLLLFQALNARRLQMEAPGAFPAVPGAEITAPPPLALPRAWTGEDSGPLAFAPAPAAPPLPPVARPDAPPVVPRVVGRTEPFSPDETATFGMRPPSQPLTLPPPLAAVPAPPAITPLAAAVAAGERVTAGRLINPGFTVPKGTIVAAVLETALDSTRPGAVRAIVSRDVKGFDGVRVLIPRGSRLYGEYAADVTSGQKRALVRWQRLTRPDGVVIELDSPSADPLGRAGVEGKVDSHFFARFGAAILQSVLDIGVGVATRSVSDNTVIVALPNSTQPISGQMQQAQQVQPTLRVRQGTSVSVFVARDLDFSTVDR